MKIFTRDLMIKLGFCRMGRHFQVQKEVEERAFKAEGREHAKARSDQMIQNTWGTVRSSNES